MPDEIQDNTKNEEIAQDGDGQSALNSLDVFEKPFPVVRERKLENGSVELEMPDYEGTTIVLDKTGNPSSYGWQLKNEGENKVFTSKYHSFTILKDGSVIHDGINDQTIYARLSVDENGISKYKNKDGFEVKYDSGNFVIKTAHKTWSFDQNGILTVLENGKKDIYEPHILPRGNNKNLNYGDGSSMYFDNTYKTIEYGISVRNSENVPVKRSFSLYQYRPSLISDSQVK